MHLPRRRPRLDGVTLLLNIQSPCPPSFVPSFHLSSRPSLRSLRRDFHTTTHRHVNFTLPDELARSIPKDQRQRQVDSNTPLLSETLSYWKQVARAKEEIPYKKFPTAEDDRWMRKSWVDEDVNVVPAGRMDTEPPAGTNTEMEWAEIDTYIKHARGVLASEEPLAPKSPLTTEEAAKILDPPPPIPPTPPPTSPNPGQQTYTPSTPPAPSHPPHPHPSTPAPKPSASSTTACKPKTDYQPS